MANGSFWKVKCKKTWKRKILGTWGGKLENFDCLIFLRTLGMSRQIRTVLQGQCQPNFRPREIILLRWWWRCLPGFLLLLLFLFFLVVIIACVFVLYCSSLLHLLLLFVFSVVLHITVFFMLLMIDDGVACYYSYFSSTHMCHHMPSINSYRLHLYYRHGIHLEST